MRPLLLCLVALLAAGTLVVACDTADPSQCFPNTGNGFGGSATIPIGAGVGVGAGNMGISPPRIPLGYTDANNPCVTHGSDTTPPTSPPPGQGTSTGTSGAGGSSAAPPLPLCDADGGAGSAGSGGATPDADGGAATPCIMPPENPCFEQCNVDYENAALTCGMIADDAQRKTCQDNAYAAYKSCRANCTASANKSCDDKYQDCVDNGPSSCLKRSGGKTQCYRCWERCNAGDSPSSECKTCRF
jgi:hypothetical protein